jgi:hypothetical protein
MILGSLQIHVRYNVFVVTIASSVASQKFVVEINDLFYQWVKT